MPFCSLGQTYQTTKIQQKLNKFYLQKRNHTRKKSNGTVDFIEKALALCNQSA